MTRRMLTGVGAAAVLIWIIGCSGGDALRVGMNLKRKDSNIKIWLDGQEAKQNKVKKGATGYARFEVKEPVSTSPKFKYEIDDPDKFGFIKHVMMQVHQKFEADFSDIPDYVICSRDMKDRKANLKPGVEYDLANMGDQFMILDKQDNEVKKIEFKPGVKYMLSFTIVADNSESTQIFFDTK